MKLFKKLAAMTLAVLMLVSVLPLGSAAKAFESRIDVEEPAVVDPEVQYVIDAIAALPAAAEITLEHEEWLNSVQAMYDRLNAEQQAQVSNHFMLETAFDALAARHAEQEISATLDALEPIDVDDTDAVNAAYDIYLALSERQKSFFNSALLEQLVSAKNQIDEGWEAIHNVESMIANLPNPPSPEDIAAVEAAIGGLTEAQKEALSADALAYFEALKTAQFIIDLPYILGYTGDPNPDVDIVVAHRQLVDNARSTYDDLSSAQQVLVINYDYLVESEAVMEVVEAIAAVLAEHEPTIANLSYFQEALAMYDALETYVNINGETKDVRDRVGNYQELQDTIDEIIDDQEEVNDLIAQIDAIPDRLLPEHQSVVEAARSAYDALNDEQKSLITNYDYLVQSENVMEVVLLINEVPKPIMPADEAKINAAREAYDDLEEAAQPRVGNYEHLTLAEAALPVVLEIDELPAPEDILLADTEQINKVKADYDALTDAEKEYVGNYPDLEAALARIAELWQQVNDALALLEQVYAKRNDPLYPADNDLITAAREAFDALNADQQNYISTNYPHLIAELENAEQIMEVVLAVDGIPKPLMPSDEDALKEVKEAYDALNPEQQARVGNYENLEAANDAMEVVLMIDAIPDPIMIEYTEQIEAARAAYNDLSELAKEYVGNYSELTFAESELERLWAEIQNVIDLINAIPFPLYLHDAPAVVTARGAYDALTPEQQTYIYNYWKLVYAERDLATIYGQIAIVMTCITALPDPVSLADADTVAAIWRAYEALDAEQQAEITNLPKLLAAMEQLQAIQNQIAAVEALIDAIPNPLTAENYDEYAAAVAAAREAYNAIANPSDAARVSNYDELLEAEAALADLAAAREVIELILDLPNPIHADDAAAIQQARASYNALTNTQKTYVSNYPDLELAEEVLAVELLIDAIGIGEFTSDELVAVLAGLDLVAIEDSFNAALEAYNALTAEGKALAADGSNLLGLGAYYAKCYVSDNGETRFVDILFAVFADQRNREKIEAAYNMFFEQRASRIMDLEDNQENYIAHLVMNQFREDAAFSAFLMRLENEGTIILVIDDDDENNNITVDWNLRDIMNIQGFVKYLYYTVPNGDVDGDGTTSMVDALLSMRVAMGVLEPGDLNVYDANGDGQINLIDSLLIMRMAMGVNP